MGTLFLWEPVLLRALIINELDKDEVPIKIWLSPVSLNTEQENKHDIHDHEYTIARSKW